MNKIKNIIFDLGGVVIDLQRHKAIEALVEIGVTDAAELLGDYGQKGAFLQLETGMMTTAEFYDSLIPKCRPGVTAVEIRDAFEKFLKRIPLSRLEMLRKLRDKGYRLYVLSNTNPLMYNHWIDAAFRGEGKTINDYFDGIVTSFQEKTCKPDPRIFRNLIERYHLDPVHTLMLDDSEANCEAARSVGLQAIKITKDGENSFASVCEKLLNDADA